MKQLRFAGQGKLEYDDVPDLEPKPGEVVIKTAVSVLCGSEMGAYRGNGMKAGNGGHEAAGIVLKLGKNVTNLKVGDRVGVSPVAPCDDPACPYCSKGQFTWCKHWKFYGNFHSEQFLAGARACQVLPDDIDWATGVLITGDGFGVPYHSSTKFINKDPSTIAIFGAGPIGLGNVILQAYYGRRIIVSDISEARLELARKFGASATINPKEKDAVETIKELTDGVGADIAIECAGRPETVHQCFAAVRTGGQVIFNGEQPEVPISISGAFIRRDITATGSWFYHFCEYSDMLRLCRKGLQAKSLVTHRLPFAEAAKGYELFAAGKTGKVLFEY